jgi:hypothetical protein
MKIDSETIPSSPSVVQREIAIDTVDPVAPFDIPRDITVGHQRAYLGLTISARGRGTYNSSRHIPREKETKEAFELLFKHESHH